jgi:hypothetical protein
MKNLIICPVGMPMIYDSRWKDQEHWRWNHNDRNYETLIVIYNDFVPEENSYDHIIHMKGHKWQIMKQVSKVFDISKYKYIGCVDDDLITDYKSFNEGLKLANAFNFKYWQLSMPSDSSLIYGCLFNDETCTFSETNFIEMGSPFFEKKYFKFLIDFISNWDLEVAWGIDKTFYDLFQCPANVVHSAMIHQPFRESYYDKSKAMNEMNDYLHRHYPRILKEKYGRDSNFRDVQNVLRKFKVE